VKGFLTVALLLTLTAARGAEPRVEAYGSGHSTSPRGTAAVDEANLEEPKIRERGLDRKARQEMEANPRNRGVVESFGGVESETEKAQLEEERKVDKRQRRREGKAQGQNYDRPRFWR
jgi:hypothetical protein